MSSAESLGITAFHAMTWYVDELSRKRRLFEAMGFRQVVSSAAPLIEDDGQESVTYKQGSCRFVCIAPKRHDSRAAQYLRVHPEGIGCVTFEARDLTRTAHELARRGATFVSGKFDARANFIEIATPIDDLNFCFVQGPEAANTQAPSNRPTTGPSHFDHVTINTGTILPMALWLEHLLGFEPYWEIEFHTADLRAEGKQGSGLKSTALWDPVSQIRFALNEPKPPNFFASQIELFRRDHRGSGIQHVACHVGGIAEVVSALRRRGIKFAPTPNEYYDQLQARLDQRGVGRIEEPLETLRELGILVDGSGEGRYLLQTFMEDDASFLGGGNRSPFFLELIERKGCPEFGAGNFRALFESIESAQATRQAPPSLG